MKQYFRLNRKYVVGWNRSGNDADGPIYIYVSTSPIVTIASREYEVEEEDILQIHFPQFKLITPHVWWKGKKS